MEFFFIDVLRLWERPVYRGSATGKGDSFGGLGANESKILVRFYVFSKRRSIKKALHFRKGINEH